MSDFFADILWWLFPLLILGAMTLVVLAVARQRSASNDDGDSYWDNAWDDPRNGPNS